MSMFVYENGDFIVDDGSWKRCYPIPEGKEEFEDIIHDRIIQRTSYIQATIVGVFNDWFKSFFAPTYFRTERIKTQSTIADFKSWLKGIYKKDMPILVIDPSAIESVEDSLFGQNMLNRYNLVDPNNENISAKMIYSLNLMESDMFQLAFRRNRFRFEISTMIVERTLDRAINTYNSMLMNMRHNSKFMLNRTIPCLIPTRFIQNIANFHGFDDINSEEFVKFLNSISQYPIIRQSMPNNQTMFLFNYNINVQVEVPDFPQRDDPEKNEAIEWGARVVDRFTFIADLPTEFIFLMPKRYMTKFDRGVPEDPDGIYAISPVYADLDWPKEINGYKLTNRADIMLDSGDNPEVNVISLLQEYNPHIYQFVLDFIHHGQNLNDLILAQVYPNGSYINIASELLPDGTLRLHNPEAHKIYTVNLYVNFGLMNLIKEKSNEQYVGTMKKDPY